MNRQSAAASIEKNFKMLSAVLIAGILIVEAVLFSVYSDRYHKETETAARKAAESKRIGLENFLEQLEAEIDFVIRQDRQEALLAAKERVESFAAAVAEVEATPETNDDLIISDYLKTINKSAGDEYVYVLNKKNKLTTHPLKDKLDMIIPPDEINEIRNKVNAISEGGSAVVTYNVFTEQGKIVRKTSYIKSIPPHGWKIASGFSHEKSIEKIQSYIIKQLESLVKDQNSLSFFIVLSSSSEIIGTGGNISEDQGYGLKLKSRLGDASSSFFYEITQNSENMKHLRMTAVRRIPEWNWIVAAGFDETPRAVIKSSISKDLKHKLYAYTAASAAAAAALIFLVITLTARSRRSLVKSLENSFIKAENRTKELKLIGKKLEEEHLYVINTERRLGRIKDNLEKTVEERIRDLKDISIHLRKENLKIAKVNNELIAARKKATEASMVKTEFLANMSHEIRTPIHAILSYSSFGFKKFENTKDQRQKGYFIKISESAGRLLSFINDLTDLSDLESGRTKYKVSKFNVTGLLKGVVKDLERVFIEKNIAVRVPENGTLICADEARLRQVFLNIYSNAAKFSPPDSLIITDIISENSIVKIIVTDFGPGVDESEKLLIFEKFTQSSKTKTGAGGIGLGLAICREIVTDHGGSIYVTDNPEGGSCFTVELPLF